MRWYMMDDNRVWTTTDSTKTAAEAIQKGHMVIDTKNNIVNFSVTNACIIPAVW
jgi:hypothetical protein